MRVLNFVRDENYQGPIKIFISQTVKIKNGMMGISCNGVNIDYKKLKDLNFKNIKNNISKFSFIWNYPSDELLITGVLIGKKNLATDEKILKKIGKDIFDIWINDLQIKYEKEPILKLESGEEYFAEINKNEDEVSLSAHPIELPKGKIWLGTLFKTPEFQVLYEEFVQNKAILSLLCKKYQIEYKDDISIINIPCQIKDLSTDEIVIGDYTAKMFNRYCLALNYFEKAEEEISHENLIGKLIILDPNFANYL